jgi:hypothetical protein
MIIVENHGQLITATNYWELDLEREGKLYVSVNAGAIRVLVPRSHRQMIEEFRGAECAILSRGPWPQMGLPEAVEVLWEDHSKNPFALHLSPSSFDLLPAEPPQGREWIISVWDNKKGKPHKAVERRCYWRRVPYIPWLKSWGENQ